MVSLKLPLVKLLLPLVIFAIRAKAAHNPKLQKSLPVTSHTSAFVQLDSFKKSLHSILRIRRKKLTDRVFVQTKDIYLRC